MLDAAILLETGWDDLCDRVVFVEAPRDVRLARLASQRGWTDEVLAARERAQWPPDRKRGRADAVVVNADGLDALAAEVDRLAGAVLKPSRAGRDAPRDQPPAPAPRGGREARRAPRPRPEILVSLSSVVW